jgi:hypothetical protein
MDEAQFQMTCPKCGSYSFTVRRDQRAYVHKSQPFELVFSCRCGKQLFGDQIQEEYDRQKAIWEQERQAGAADSEEAERAREEERRNDQLRRAMEYRRTYLAERRRQQAEEERLRKEEEDRRWREKVARVEAEERGVAPPPIAPRPIPTRPTPRKSEPLRVEPPRPRPEPVVRAEVRSPDSGGRSNEGARPVDPPRQVEPVRAADAVRPVEPARSPDAGRPAPVRAAEPSPARPAAREPVRAAEPAPALVTAVTAIALPPGSYDPALADPEHPHAEFMPYVLDGTFAELFPDAVPPDRKDPNLCVWPPCEKTRRKKSKYCSRECSNKNARWRHKMRRKDGDEDGDLDLEGED